MPSAKKDPAGLGRKDALKKAKAAVPAGRTTPPPPDGTKSMFKVGKYFLLETVGEGSFGKVKLGMHEDTGVRYAVKVMAKSRISTPSLTMQVRREVAVMKALRHKNIVRLYEVLTSSKHVYLVMELVTGGELFDIISDRGRLSEADGRVYFQQLVCGIDYCHRRLVYHRDLKPENLMLGEDGSLKIVDFGLSSIKSANSGTELLHTVCGTPHYTSPEVITSAKDGYDGAKFDVWSSGIILYGMLCGFLPFDEDTERALYDAIVKDQLIFPSHLSTEVKEVLSGMLDKDPDARWSFADVKKHPWFLEGWAGEEEDASVPTSSAAPAVSADAAEEEDEEARRQRRKKLRAKKKRAEAASGGASVSSDLSADAQELVSSGGADTASLTSSAASSVAAPNLPPASTAVAPPRVPSVDAALVPAKAESGRQQEDKKPKLGASSGSRGSRPAEGGLAAAPAARAPKSKAPASHRHRSGRSRSPAPAEKRASPKASRRAPSESAEGRATLAAPAVAAAAAAAATAAAVGLPPTPRVKRKGPRTAVGRHASPQAPQDIPPLGTATAEATPTSPISPPGSALTPAVESTLPRLSDVAGDTPRPLTRRASTTPTRKLVPVSHRPRSEAAPADVDSGADPRSGLLATSATLGQEGLAASADASVDEQLDAIADDHMTDVQSVSAAEVTDGARGTASADAKEVLSPTASVTDIQSLRFFLPAEALQAVARNKNPLLSRLRGRTPGLPTLCATQGAPRFVLE